MRLLLAVATVVAALLGPMHGSAVAQPARLEEAEPSGRVPPSPAFSAGFYLIPSFKFTEEFDDNIFASGTNKQWDFISRFSPGLEAGYRSEPFTLLVSGGFDSEVLARHPDLNEAVSGWHAGLTGLYLPIRPLTLGLTVAYVETHTTSTVPTSLAPAVILPATVLQFGRVKATFLAVSPSAEYRFTPTTAGSTSYTYTHDTIETGVPTTAHTMRAGLSHDFTPIDKGILAYRTTIFESAGETITDYVPTIGWVRQLTRATKLTLSGGPLFVSDGSVAPEVHARLDHELPLAKLFLDYARSDSFVLGQAGVAKTETFAGGADWEPIRFFHFIPTVTVTKLRGLTTGDTTLYDLSLMASYQILRWLTARGGYRFLYQEQRGPDIPRNIVSLSLEVTYPYRYGQ